MKKTELITLIENQVRKQLNENNMTDLLNFKNIFAKVGLGNKFTSKDMPELVDGKYVDGKPMKIENLGEMSGVFESCVVKPKFGKNGDKLYLDLDYKWKYTSGGSNGDNVRYVFDGKSWNQL